MHFTVTDSLNNIYFTTTNRRSRTQTPADQQKATSSTELDGRFSLIAKRRREREEIGAKQKPVRALFQRADNKIENAQKVHFNS